MKSVQSLKNWFPILDWGKRPNLGLCHNIDNYDLFCSNYYDGEDVKRCRMTLLSTLTGGHHEQLNRRILGQPGSGKTTFIYSLIKGAQSGHIEELQDHYFYVFHVNRASADIDNIVQEHVFDAWRGYFSACGQNTSFTRIYEQRISNRDKLNKLMGHVRSHRTLFKKLFIFVLDDTDLLDSDQLSAVARSVMIHIELASVKKWIVIRESTYTGYDQAAQFLINSFFPDQTIFPRIPLYDIINHRIMHTSEGASPKNPFSPKLCDVVQKLHEGNLRESLGTLSIILAHNMPKKIETGTDIEFIRNYLDHAAIRTLLESNVLPNIHDERLRTISLPIPLDIIKFVRFVQDRKKLVNLCTLSARNRADLLAIPSEGQKFNFGTAPIDYSIEQLCERGILYDDRRGGLRLSPRGILLSDYSTQPFYTDACMTFESESGEAPQLYWAFVKTTVNYEKIVMSTILWG